jgi:hypothetical protein
MRVPNHAVPQKPDLTGTSVGEHAERWWLAWEWDTEEEYHTHTWRGPLDRVGYTGHTLAHLDGQRLGWAGG